MEVEEEDRIKSLLLTFSDFLSFRKSVGWNSKQNCLQFQSLSMLEVVHQIIRLHSTQDLFPDSGMLQFNTAIYQY